MRFEGPWKETLSTGRSLESCLRSRRFLRPGRPYIQGVFLVSCGGVRKGSWGKGEIGCWGWAVEGLGRGSNQKLGSQKLLLGKYWLLIPFFDETSGLLVEEWLPPVVPQSSSCQSISAIVGGPPFWPVPPLLPKLVGSGQGKYSGLVPGSDSSRPPTAS